MADPGTRRVATARRTRTLIIALVAVVALSAAARFAAPGRFDLDATVIHARMAAVARQHPRFSVRQLEAIERARYRAAHPRLSELSPAQAYARLSRLALSLMTASSATATTQAPAMFVGNLTAFQVDSTHTFQLARQADCSLTFRELAYTLTSAPSFAYNVVATQASYDRLLHNNAGLTTTPGQFPAGCGDPANASSARPYIRWLGQTAGGVNVYAHNGADLVNGGMKVYEVTTNAQAVVQATTAPLAAAEITAMAHADLNGDGVADLVAFGESSINVAAVYVLLGKADGSFQSPITIPIAGAHPASGVIDDFNGDGHADIATVSQDSQGTFYLVYIAGKGDGTFAAPTATALTPPAGAGLSPYVNLVSADLRGRGTKDLVTGAGLVLSGNGDGTFAASATRAFTSAQDTGGFGPNVAAADLNKDGKLDLVVANGQSVSVYYGRGDGTFVAGPAYASISNVGYIDIADIDGDGNLDVYPGAANAGQFTGDNGTPSAGYVLFGNGDGTLRGAPVEPFAYTGTNVTDLNGDGHADAVGVDGSGAFQAYIGDGKGGFAQKTALTYTPVSIGGTTYQVTGIDGYAVGDVNGDGKPDIVYVGTQFSGPNGAAGFFVALGHGDGTFGAPTFFPMPQIVPAGDYDTNVTLSDVRLADVNGDGRADLIYSYKDQAYHSQDYYLGTAIQLANADGTFQPAQLLNYYTGPNNAYTTSDVVAIADLNADHNPDLVLVTESLAPDPTTSQYTYSVQVALGNGRGGFAAPVSVVTADSPSGLLTGTQFAPVQVADMNGDGKPDLVVGGADSQGALEVAIALGNGDGTFRAPNKLSYGAQYLPGMGIAVADFNGDGKPDVILTGLFGAADTGISLGNGDGTLQSAQLGSSVVPSLGIYLGVGGAVMTADFNGDGRMDVLAGNVLLLGQAAPVSAPAVTTTTLTLSNATITAGDSVTLTATVASAGGGGTPTGSVTFKDGTTALATTTLSTGVATYATTALATGTHSLSASYGGDSTHGASSSTAVSLTVNAAAGGSSGGSSGGGSSGGSSGGGGGAVTGEALACIGLLAGLRRNRRPRNPTGAA